MELHYKNTAGVSESELKRTATGAFPYIKTIQNATQDSTYLLDESSVHLSFDEKLRAAVLDIFEKTCSAKLRYVVVIGIGGSNLGTQAIDEAMCGTLSAFEHGSPHLLFADTVSASKILSIGRILEENCKSAEEFLLVLISKSGATTETAANFEVLYQSLRPHYAELNSRVVVITDEGSKLWLQAEEKKFARLSIPKKVGGRFSVFSAVGLFPLVCAFGKDAMDFLHEGAENMVEQCTGATLKNPALVSATLTHLHAKKGLYLNNNFFFNPELESVGRWYRQLMGESIGKEKNREGKTVHAGITPIVSIGSTDLHSMAQLYFGGPRDKFTNFVYAPPEITNETQAKIPDPLELPDLVEGIAGRNLSDLMDAIYEGTKRTYQKNQLPFMEVRLRDISFYSLGQYLQFKMIEMMFLAELMNVNAFNQPNVEEYKEETRKILV